MSLIETRDRLAALLALSGLRVSSDPGRSADAPCLIVTLPTLTYEGYSPEPDSATFKVPLVVPSDDRTGDQLLTLLPAVQQVIHESTDAISLTGAEPGSWGSPPLPCFLLTIEVSV